MSFGLKVGFSFLRARAVCAAADLPSNGPAETCGIPPPCDHHMVGNRTTATKHNSGRPAPRGRECLIPLASETAPWMGHCEARREAGGEPVPQAIRLKPPPLF